jgi:hypothetical protein
VPHRIPGFLVGLLALVAWFVLYGFLIVYRYTLRPLLEGLAWFLDKIKIHAWKIHIDFGPWLAGKIRDVELWVRNEIAHGVLAAEHIAVSFLHAAAHLFSALGHFLGDLPMTILHVFHYLRHVVIPRLIHAAVHLLKRLLAVLWRWVRHLYRWTVKEFNRIWRWARHVVGALWHALAGLWRWARWLYRFVVHGFRDVWKLLRWLHRYLSWKNLKRVVGALLHDLGLGWLFARNVIHVAQAIIGWSWHTLRAVVRWITRLDDSLTIEGVVHASQETALETVRAMHWFLREYDETITTGEIPIPPVE